MTISDGERLEQRLLKIYGVVIGGDDLWKVLGLRSAASLKRHIKQETLGLQTFTIPGRRGRYATVRAIALWAYELEHQQSSSRSESM